MLRDGEAADSYTHSSGTRIAHPFIHTFIHYAHLLYIHSLAYLLIHSMIHSLTPPLLPPSVGGGAERGRDIRADEQPEEGGHLLLLPQPGSVEHLGGPLQDRRGR